MKLTARTFGLSLVAVAVLAGCAQTGPYQQDRTYRLTILHTNDHHGHFWKNADGEYGLAARKTLVDRIRAEVKAQGGYTLLLDGGDVNTGVPESDLLDAEPDFKGMNKLGYDAMAVGNHEFDKPLSVLKKQARWADFPLLSANVYQGGQRLFKPYQIFNLGGIKVAVMGLTTDDTWKLVNPDNIKGVEFRNPIEEASRLVPELRAQADVVIAATHMGHYEDGRHGVNAAGDVEMARAVKGIDLIVGGHSQNPVCMKAENVTDKEYVPGGPCRPDRQNGAWIVQAHEWGKYVGRADFEFRNGQLRLVKYALIPVNLMKSVKAPDGKVVKTAYTELIPEDQHMLAYLKPFQDKGQEKLGVEVGRTDGKLEGDRAVVRKEPTNLGVLLATAMMEKAKADVAVLNSGGIRDSLPAGVVTYRDVLKVQPFASTLVYADLSGKELTDYLAAAARMTPGAGAFPQFAGVRLLIENGELKSARIKGQPIDPTRTYRLATNSFVAAGGDGYPKLAELRGFVNTGFVDADILKDFIAARSPLRTADFRPGDAVVRK
ncbi:2',3'-cyclic-nucleotide 2'-phosphodiesterase/5'-or 3'-nucleotidase, 5'-nucleotidase family [Gulbenkiania indica]|uniref:2',3'-cyclic-nucleotide 2'-phosphodiesterase/5'-or 3'-nucleotidase, 5'-nucleotidase family n=2 Tax=Gulbenkiania TaxID=397456 RepID=A0A0K6GUP2_9NEIS|nr:bifunctional UDP-sugar hydrolase/5'-nucleotidase UshA [Gulbenkiania indica]TCW33939.1 5'-nucleotidase/UDP-sugar diphosphatase [Gulbenkiania mobilis]CUA82308.1 2',3'-cyclic-nucleotide 2'-phosphodiesterase/5'-or 3'-nucleotidase, 5'-nucleotidase family [Gulbenkiania indica]